VYLTIIVCQCVDLDEDGQPVGVTYWAIEPWGYLLLGVGCLIAVAGSLWWRSFRRSRRLEAALKQIWIRRNAGDHAGADEMLAHYKQLAGQS
jgi:hypothetical protein